MFAVWPSLERYWCCYGASAVMKRDRGECIGADEGRLIPRYCCASITMPLIHPASIAAGAPHPLIFRPLDRCSTQHEFKST